MDQDGSRSNPDIAELSKQGYQLLKESLTERAAELFRRILEIEPENNYALVGLGDAYRKERRYHEAMDYYRACLDHHPGNNYALFGLADCHKALGEFNRAIDVWEEYLRYDDGNVTILTRIADAYRKVRNLPRSRELYLKVLDLDADNAYALIGLGHLHYDFKEYETALEYWHRMERHGGRRIDIRVLTSIGNCYRKLKRFDEGIPYFERALEMQSGNFYALFGMADCYRGTNRPDLSLEYWNRILEKDPENKVILTRAGDAYRNLGNLEQAGRCYTDALAIDFDLYAALGLALIDKAEDRFAEAAEALDRLLERDPRNHRLAIEAAECRAALGERDEARRLIDGCREAGMSEASADEVLARLGL